MSKYVLSAPFKFEDQEITELNLDLESLTGRDISIVKREWAGLGNFSPMPSTDVDFCAMLAAKASKQPFEIIESLPAKEYTKLAQEVSNFLNS